jgi:PAS domain S-box-containing protein
VSTRTAADPIALLAVEDPELLLDAVTVTDPRGIIVAVNRAFTRLHGYEPADVIGRGHEILSSGLHPSSFIAQLWRTIATGTAWEGELVNRGADGTLRTVRSRIVPVRGPGGDISHFVAVQREVEGTDGPPRVGLLRVDVRGRCTYADQAAATLFRDDADAVALLNHGLLGSLVIEDAAALREVVEEAHRTGRSHRLDVAGASGYVRCTVEPDPSSRDLTAGPVSQVTCEPVSGDG